MQYLTRIPFGSWQEGDVLLFQRPQGGGRPYYDMIFEVKDGALVEIGWTEGTQPEPHWICDRIDYRFISDGTWYIEGTEAYPTHELDDAYGAGVFVGWTNETYKGFDGTLPRWDGESCSLEEFRIEKRRVEPDEVDPMNMYLDGGEAQ